MPPCSIRADNWPVEPAADGPGYLRRSRRSFQYPTPVLGRNSRGAVGGGKARLAVLEESARGAASQPSVRMVLYMAWASSAASARRAESKEKVRRTPWCWIFTDQPLTVRSLSPRVYVFLKTRWRQ